MASSVIKTSLEYVQTKVNKSVAGGSKITELTIPTDGTYIIAWGFGFQAQAWFNGVNTTTATDYHVGNAQVFVRDCQANEVIWLQNGSGTATNFYGTLSAIKLA